MAATITLKNIPDALYQRLKESAVVNHRSINREVIACLERVLAERDREQQREQWRHDNRDAIARYNRQVEKEGVFSDKLRSF